MMIDAMEDDEWDNIPTVEDVLSSVLKSTSKFGKVKLVAPFFTQKSTNLKKDVSPENGVEKTKSEELRSYLTQSEVGKERSGTHGNLTHLHQASGGKQTSDDFNIYHKDKLALGKCDKYNGSESTSKMKHTQSTPALGVKHMPKYITPEEVAGPRSSSICQTNLNSKVVSAVGNKENTNPYALLSDKLSEKISIPFEAVNKDLHKKTQAFTRKEHHIQPIINLEDKNKVENGRGLGLGFSNSAVPKNSEALLENGSLFMSSSVKNELASNKSHVERVKPGKANTCPSINTQNCAAAQERLSSKPLISTKLQENVPDTGLTKRSTASHSIKAIAEETQNSTDDVMDYSASSEGTAGQSISRNSKTLASSQYKTHSKSQNTAPMNSLSCVSSESRNQEVALKGASQTSKKSQVTPGNCLQHVSLSRTSSQRLQKPTTEHRSHSHSPTPPKPHKLMDMANIIVNGKEYVQLELLGQGGSSKVYEVLDFETRKVMAIKVVNLEGVDDVALSSYKNEIDMLLRLQWSDKVIRLYDYEVNDRNLKLVMEKGSQDLATILSRARSKRTTPISPFTIQHYWQEMLLAVQTIHQEGIIHSDLKPANFLLVDGTVKLIDFGIASSIQQDMTSVVKENQGGTFNYMSPESLMDVQTGPIVNGRSTDTSTIKIGVKSDVWSLGCILYNLVYGRTPFQHISNTCRKLWAICNPDSKINFPEIEDKEVMDVLKLCLQYNPSKRPTIQELLDHPYLTKHHTSKKIPSTPNHVKRIMSQLEQLTPDTLERVTSVMKEQLPDVKSN